MCEILDLISLDLLQSCLYSSFATGARPIASEVARLLQLLLDSARFSVGYAKKLPNVSIIVNLASQTIVELL